MLNEMIADMRVPEANPAENGVNQAERDPEYESGEDLDLLVNDSDWLDYGAEHMETEQCNVDMLMY